MNTALSSGFERLRHQAITHNMHEISLLTNQRLATEPELLEQQFAYKKICTAWMHVRGGFTPMSLCTQKKMTYKSYHAQQDAVVSKMTPPNLKHFQDIYQLEFEKLESQSNTLNYANQWLQQQVMAAIENFDKTNAELNKIKQEGERLLRTLQVNRYQTKAQNITYQYYRALFHNFASLYRHRASDLQISKALSQLGVMMQQPENQKVWQMNAKLKEHAEHINHHIEALLSHLETEDTLIANDTEPDTTANSLQHWLQKKALSITSRDPKYWLAITQEKIFEIYHHRHKPESKPLAQQLSIFYPYIKAIYLQIKTIQITHRHLTNSQFNFITLPTKLLKQTKEGYIEQQNKDLWQLLTQINPPTQLLPISINHTSQFNINRREYSKSKFNKLSLHHKLTWLDAMYDHQTNLSGICRPYDDIFAEALERLGHTLHQKNIPFIPLFYFELSHEIQRNELILKQNKAC